MTRPVSIALKRLDHGRDLPLPSYASAGAAGLDLCAAVSEPVVLAPGARVIVPTGFAMAVPQGFEAQIRPRSGLAAKHGMTVLNAPGTIDCDYRGEVGIILINLGEKPLQITRGMRIAQMVIAPVIAAGFREVTDLPQTRRGSGGFGSTGTAATGERQC